MYASAEYVFNASVVPMQAEDCIDIALYMIFCSSPSY